MNRPDNKRTTQVCRYLIENGIPISAEPNSFEQIALDWLNEVRANLSNLHSSDLAIITQSGLRDKIFPPIQQIPQFDKALAEIQTLKKQLADITSKIYDTVSKVKIPTKRTGGTCGIGGYDSSSRRWRMIHRGRIIRQTILQLRSFFNRKDIPFDEQGSLRYWQMWLRSNHPEVCHRFPAQTEATPVAEETHPPIRYRTIVKPVSEELPPVQTAPVQPTPVQTAPVQTAPVQTAPVQPTPVAQTRTTRRRIPNPNVIWAKSVYERKPLIEESDLIGFAKLRSKDGRVFDVGIENYAIYPSGNIKYYFRYRNSKGQYSTLVFKWNNDASIVSVNLKPEFDFGGI